mmetsp:Transcript_54277/g.153793  ORF Transcript_54277/g.153793 Transcript_54277/m.153793 type:complete len:126 (-) Transcript_54277:21-398(-)
MLRNIKVVVAWLAAGRPIKFACKFSVFGTLWEWYGVNVLLAGFATAAASSELLFDTVSREICRENAHVVESTDDHSREKGLPESSMSLRKSSNLLSVAEYALIMVTRWRSWVGSSVSREEDKQKP